MFFDIIAQKVWIISIHFLSKRQLKNDKQNTLPFLNSIIVGHYHPFATLALESAHDSIRMMFSRDRIIQMNSADQLVVFLICYFTGAVISTGTYLAAGIIVPTLLTGALLGNLDTYLFTPTYNISFYFV